MKAYIIVDRPTDAEILKRTLPADVQEEVTFVIAQERGSMTSLARTLLVDRRVPVAVVVDSHSVHRETIDERQQNMEELIGLVSGNIPMRVIMAVPTIEAIFFEDLHIVEKLTGSTVPGDLVRLAKHAPKEVLTELGEKTQSQWSLTTALRALDAQDIAALQSAPVIQELTKFLHKAQQVAA